VPEIEGASSVAPDGDRSNDRSVPWRGSDVALVLGGGVLSVILAALAVGVALDAFRAEASPATYAVFQVLAYSGQASIAWWVLFRRRRAAPKQLGFRWVGAGPLLLMFPALFGLIVINYPVGVLTNFLFDDVTTPREQLLGRGDSLPMEAFIPMFFVVVVVAPVVEEFIFRGMLFRLLRSNRSFWTAASLSALAFSISHLIPSLVLFLFVLGIVFAWVVERYESVYPAMALHALNNGFVMVLLYVSLN
jgi:uncharacterized protein